MDTDVKLINFMNNFMSYLNHNSHMTCELIEFLNNNKKLLITNSLYTVRVSGEIWEIWAIGNGQRQTEPRLSL